MNSQIDPVARLSTAELCRWVELDPSTREGWVDNGLVRHLGQGGADYPAVAEMFIVSMLVKELNSVDQAHSVWVEIEAHLPSFDDPLPDALDLLWFAAPPEAILVTTNREFVDAVRQAPRPVRVFQLTPVLARARSGWKNFVKKSWRRESAQKQAQLRKAHEHRGRKSKGPGAIH